MASEHLASHLRKKATPVSGAAFFLFWMLWKNVFSTKLHTLQTKLARECVRSYNTMT